MTEIDKTLEETTGIPREQVDYFTTAPLVTDILSTRLHVISERVPVP